MKVLAVEDSASARRVMQEILLRLGLSLPEIRLASSAAEGQAVFQEWHPDVVFLDIELDGGNGGIPAKSGKPTRALPMNGGELGKLFLEENPKLKLVVVTAHDPQHPPVRALVDGGAVEVIVKPVLAAKVSQVLERVRAEERGNGPRRRW
ncbi:MAG: response regulator [Thermoplasmata archaeon]